MNAGEALGSGADEGTNRKGAAGEREKARPDRSDRASLLVRKALLGLRHRLFLGGLLQRLAGVLGGAADRAVALALMGEDVGIDAAHGGGHADRHLDGVVV